MCYTHPGVLDIRVRRATLADLTPPPGRTHFSKSAPPKESGVCPVEVVLERCLNALSLSCRQFVYKFLQFVDNKPAGAHGAMPEFQERGAPFAVYPLATPSGRGPSGRLYCFSSLWCPLPQDPRSATVYSTIYAGLTQTQSRSL